MKNIGTTIIAVLILVTVTITTIWSNVLSRGVVLDNSYYKDTIVLRDRRTIVKEEVEELNPEVSKILLDNPVILHLYRNLGKGCKDTVDLISWVDINGSIELIESSCKDTTNFKEIKDNTGLESYVYRFRTEDILKNNKLEIIVASLEEYRLDEFTLWEYTLNSNRDKIRLTIVELYRQMLERGVDKGMMIDILKKN